MTVIQNLHNIQKQIAIASAKSGRSFGEVELVVVGKYATAEQLLPLIEAGLTTIGENRVQSALEKQAILPRVTWHMIGHLQSNKIKKALALFDVIEAVDSMKLLDLLSAEAAQLGKVQSIYLQVNVAGEQSKGGFTPKDARAAFSAALKYPSLVVRGLMTMPPFVADPEGSRPFFRQLRELRDTLASAPPLPDLQLSMGTSQDFAVAIEEGATQVRIGRALFSEPADNVLYELA